MKYPVILNIKSMNDLKNNLKVSLEGFHKECEEIKATGYEPSPSLLGLYLEDGIYTLLNIINPANDEIEEKMKPVLGKPDVFHTKGGDVRKFGFESVVKAVTEGRVDELCDAISSVFGLKSDEEAKDAAEKYVTTKRISAKKNEEIKKKYHMNDYQLNKKYSQKGISVGVLYFGKSEIRPTVMGNGEVISRIDKDHRFKALFNQAYKRNGESCKIGAASGRKSYLDVKKEYDKATAKLQHEIFEKAKAKGRGIDERELPVIGKASESISEAKVYDIPETTLPLHGYEALGHLDAMNQKISAIKDNELKNGATLNYLHNLTEIHKSHGFFQMVFHPFNYHKETTTITSLKTNLKAAGISDEHIQMASEPGRYDALKDFYTYNQVIRQDSGISFVPKISYDGHLSSEAAEYEQQSNEIFAKEREEESKRVPIYVNDEDKKPDEAISDVEEEEEIPLPMEEKSC